MITFEFEIPNFSKYNPRSDVKNSSWFRMDNRWHLDDRLIAAPLTSVALWPTALATASAGLNHSSASRGQTLALNSTFISRVLGIRKRDFIKGFEYLDECGLLKITNRIESPTVRRVALRDKQTNKQTDETIAQGCPKDTPSRAALVKPKKKAPKKKSPPGPKTPSGRVWDAYRESYRQRYEQDPVRNAKVNGQIAQLVERVGAEDAASLVRFYLTHNHRFYVQSCHQVGLCLKDAEALVTQMRANYRLTASESQEADRSQGNQNAFMQVAEKYAKKFESKKEASP